jgi:hypothetical protein
MALKRHRPDEAGRRDLHRERREQALGEGGIACQRPRRIAIDGRPRR